MTAPAETPTDMAGAPSPVHSSMEIHRAMCEMPYTHYVVGSTRDGEACGMVADWVTQVCFKPRRMAVAFENDAHTLENIRRSKVFTLSLPSADQMDVVAPLLQPHAGSKIGGRSTAERRRVHHKMESVEHELRPNGCPVLADCLMWIECEVEEFIDAGDHTIAIAVVRDCAEVRRGEPLTSVVTGWEYGG